MRKKSLAILLIAIMLFSMSLTASADVVYTSESAQTLLKSLNIMSGDQNGNMNLENNLTRAEFSKIAINASKYKNSVALGAKISVFKDCTYTHWAAPYVKVAVTNGVITGYPDGTFKPENNVLYEEAITVMLKLLGYTNDDFGNSWPYGQASLAANLGLSDNVVAGIGEYLTRQDVLALTYNTLIANKKDSNTAYISDVDGVLHDNVIIMATNKEDTSVAPGSVLTSTGTFTSADFNGDYVGLKGDLAVKSNGEIICFMPYVQNSDKYVVYSILPGSVVVYDNGNLTELSLSDNTTVYSGSDKLTFSSAKSQMSIGDVIYVVKNSGGLVEYLTLTKDSLIGPETLSVYTSEWYRHYTDDASSLTVMRNGEKVSYTDVKANDVLYYSEDLNIVFAYAKTVTGIYEKALPNKDTPTTVVVSGVEYEIESVAAFNKLSSSGNLSYGSSVTLLFGKDGKIADVVTTSSSSDDLVAYLTGTGKKTFENVDGENYTSRYVTMIRPDGSEVEFTTDIDYSNYINQVMKVNLGNGVAKLGAVSKQTSLTGTVSASKMTIGSARVADDVRILDVSSTNKDHGGNAVTTYMSRIDGISLGSSSVIWYGKNFDGEVDEIILNDVTGDSSLYGIITDCPDSSSSKEDTDKSKGFTSSSGSYTMDVNGKEYKLSGGIYANLSYISPVKIEISGSSVKTLSALKALSGGISEVTPSSITAGGTEYKLSDKVVVYEKKGSRDYSIIPINELVQIHDDYMIKAYYDKSENLGGRIRVIIIQK